MKVHCSYNVLHVMYLWYTSLTWKGESLLLLSIFGHFYQFITYILTAVFWQPLKRYEMVGSCFSLKRNSDFCFCVYWKYVRAIRLLLRTICFSQIWKQCYWNSNVSRIFGLRFSGVKPVNHYWENCVFTHILFIFRALMANSLTGKVLSMTYIFFLNMFFVVFYFNSYLELLQ